MLDFLAVLTVMLLLVVGLLATTAWLTIRRIRRSRLVATGRELVADGALAVTAYRPGLSGNRAAALRALRISRDHRQLRRCVNEAQRGGVHVGDVPGVLPRLEAEGRRIRAGLARLPVGSTPAGEELLARADRHLAALASLRDAVGAALALPDADGTVGREAEEAALGLRLYTAAYTELAGEAQRPPDATVPPRAQAS